MAATKRNRSRIRRVSRLLAQLIFRFVGIARRTITTRPVAGSSLKALSLAALALPGMIPGAWAQVEEAEVQYGHYAQDGRPSPIGPDKLWLKWDPLTADSAGASFKFKLNDQTKWGLSFFQETWSGATAMITAPMSGVVTGTMTMASAWPNNAPDAYGPVKGAGAKPIELMTNASAETRRQVNLSVDHNWNAFGMTLGAGISDERDYKSLSANLGGHWDLDQKRTTLSFGINYAHSKINALLPTGMMMGYAEDPYKGGGYDLYKNPGGNGYVWNDSPETYGLHVHFAGKRDDTALNFGLTQVLDKNSLLTAGVAVSHNQGFLENPYKLVWFAANYTAVDPNDPTGTATVLASDVMKVAEKRPDKRDQLTLSSGWTHYVEQADAAAKLDYSFSHDTWGVNAHTLEASWAQNLGGGWMATPHTRYYTQSAARFYQPYFYYDLTASPARSTPPFYYNVFKLPETYYSSDSRLAGYGDLSVGVTINKKLDRGVSLELGFEHLVHSGKLKWGGGGAADFADYSSNLINLAIKSDFSNKPMFRGNDSDIGGEHAMHDHGGHDLAGHDHSSHADTPAGVMFAHTMAAGDFMVDYHVMNSQQSGGMRHGSNAASDAEILAACQKPVPGDPAPMCGYMPHQMKMRMHMLDIMYAPSDNLTLMFMPQYVSMEMNMRGLWSLQPLEWDPSQLWNTWNPGAGINTSIAGGMPMTMDMSRMSTGGLGDTTLAALFKLKQTDRGEVHLGLGVSVPTGSVEQHMVDPHSPYQAHWLMLNGELLDYSMQLGSGTWDLLPSLTVTGQGGRWSWGGQLSGVKRLQSRNASGYALGDVIQGTIWGGYRFSDGLSGFLRFAHTDQGAIKGRMRSVGASTSTVDWNTFQASGPSGRIQYSPNDRPENYGGRYNDLGLGFNWDLGDSVLKFEWLKPFKDNVNGYQLARSSTVNLTWSTMFSGGGHHAFADWGDTTTSPLWAGSRAGRPIAETAANALVFARRDMAALFGQLPDRSAFIGGIAATDPSPFPALSSFATVRPASLDDASATFIAGLRPVSVGDADTAFRRPAMPAFTSGADTKVSGSLYAAGRSNGNGMALGAEVSETTSGFAIAYRLDQLRSGNLKDGNGQTIQASEFRNRDQAVSFAKRLDGGAVTLTVTAEDTPRQGATSQLLDLTDGRVSSVDLDYLGVFSWGTLEASAFRHHAKQQGGLLDDKSALGWVLPNEDLQGSEAGLRIQANLAAGHDDVLRIGQEYRRSKLDSTIVPGNFIQPWAKDFYTGDLLPTQPANNIAVGKEDRLAFFAEWQGHVAARWTALAGARFEQVTVNSGAVQGMVSPTNDMYGGSWIYLIDALSINGVERRRVDNNWDFTVSTRYEPSPSKTLEFGYARKTRSPNLYERYLWSSEFTYAGAINSPYGDGNSYAGNVDLKPEVAHTLRATLDLQDEERKDWRLKVSPFYSYVVDYITANPYPNSPQTYWFIWSSPPNPGREGLVPFNHDARLHGIDLSGSKLLGHASGEWRLSGSVNYLHGTDLTVGGGLYNIMPLNGTLALNHTVPGWNSTLEWQVVAAKTRVDEVRMELPTPGYSLVNVRTSYRTGSVRIDAGISNLFDRRYALPVGGVDLVKYNFNAANLAPVNGPGRSVNLGVAIGF